jgi:hypothetical protein
MQYRLYRQLIMPHQSNSKVVTSALVLSNWTVFNLRVRSCGPGVCTRHVVIIDLKKKKKSQTEGNLSQQLKMWTNETILR